MSTFATEKYDRETQLRDLSRQATGEVDRIVADAVATADDATIAMLIHDAFDAWTLHGGEVEQISTEVAYRAFADLRRFWQQGHPGTVATQPVYRRLAEHQDALYKHESQNADQIVVIDGVLALRRLMGAGDVAEAVREHGNTMRALGFAIRANCR